MIDPDKARMAGLIRSDEMACRRCHDHDEPNHQRRFSIPARAEWGKWVHRGIEP
jgi:hypothetical protein